MPDVKEVRILNTENNVYCFLSIREDRLRDFYQFILTDRRVPTEPWMPGLSYAANLGCTAIFCRIPPKFPALDGLVWFRDNLNSFLGIEALPPVDIPEIENALGRWASTVTQLYQDGTGDEVRTEPV